MFVSTRADAACSIASLAIACLVCGCGGRTVDSLPPPVQTASDASVTDAEAGADGTQEASGGCPATVPGASDKCAAGSSCSYPVQLPCGEALELATCDDGHWRKQVPVSCGPLQGTDCNPVGSWLITYDFSGLDGGDWCTKPPSNRTLTISSLPSGALVLEFGGTATGSLSPDGCSILATSTIGYSNPSETWSLSESVNLWITGDTAKGTATLSNFGFCHASVEVQATAKRL